MNSSQILDREYLEMRARILDLAASLDRIDRAGGTPPDEPMNKLRKGFEILNDRESDRAGRVQMLFSRDYQENWTQEFQLESHNRTIND